MYFELTYIYHDCFLLETDKAVFLFDYWKDPLSGENKDFPPLLDIIEPSKPLYVIVSHHHKDHFTRRIFLWYQRFDTIRYIISNDVFKSVKFMFREGTTYSGPCPPLEEITVLKRGEEYVDENVRIRAFGSTDIGNSYLLDIEGKKVFHAGDLNAWIWKDESDEKEIKEAMGNYNAILNEIFKQAPAIDLVMFPVDSRIGSEYYTGAKLFVKKINVGIFVPMHFELVLDDEDKDQRKEDAGKFSLYANPERGEYVQLAKTRCRLRKNFS